LAASAERIEIATNAEKAPRRVDQNRPDFRAHRALRGEPVEFLRKTAVERIAAVRLVHRDVGDAILDLERECSQLHRTGPCVSQLIGGVNSRSGERRSLAPMPSSLPARGVKAERAERATCRRAIGADRM